MRTICTECQNDRIKGRTVQLLRGRASELVLEENSVRYVFLAMCLLHTQQQFCRRKWNRHSLNIRCFDLVGGFGIGHSASGKHKINNDLISHANDRIGVEVILVDFEHRLVWEYLQGFANFLLIRPRTLQKQVDIFRRF